MRMVLAVRDLRAMVWLCSQLPSTKNLISLPVIELPRLISMFTRERLKELSLIVLPRRSFYSCKQHG